MRDLLLNSPLFVLKIFVWVLSLIGVYWLSKYLRKLILKTSYANAWNRNESNNDIKISVLKGDDGSRYSVWVVNLFYHGKISNIRFRLECSEDYYYIVDIPLKYLRFSDTWNLFKAFLYSKKLYRLSGGDTSKIKQFEFSERLTYLLNSELYRANKRKNNSDNNA